MRALYGAGLLDAAAATARGGPGRRVGDGAGGEGRSRAGRDGVGWDPKARSSILHERRITVRGCPAPMVSSPAHRAVALRRRGRGRRDRGAGGGARADRAGIRARRCACSSARARSAHTRPSHNSGVIHAGVYYTPGSLKARLCVEGARELYALLRGARHRGAERCGKLILATDPGELDRLEELQRRARGQRRARAAPDRRGRDRGARAPRARDRRAALARHRDRRLRSASRAPTPHDVLDAGAEIATGCGVTACGAGRGRCAWRTPAASPRRAMRSSARARGPTAWRSPAGADPDPRIVPFRGAYLRLVPERRQPRALADLSRSRPLAAVPRRAPDRRIDGEVLIGPTALMAGARDAYALAHRAPPRPTRHARLAGHVADDRAAGGAPGSPSCITPRCARRSCAPPRATCPS